MKSDKQLREEVEAELDWDPSVDSRKIGVAVKDRIVTLTGHVSTYPERWSAQKAAQSIADIKAIANDIEVDLPFDIKRTDTEIAEAAVNALKSNVSIPMDAVKLVVRDGWITLQGQVNWWYQKNVAESAVRWLRGVKGVSNIITIKPAAPNASAAEIKTKIEGAFQRHAHLDAQKIRVTVGDGTVTLEGDVPTWHEREEAEMAAWAAPGVLRVEDRLIVRS